MQKLHFLALFGNFGEVFPGVGPADLLSVSLRTGDAPPDGALPLLRGKGRTKTRPAAPPRHSPPSRKALWRTTTGSLHSADVSGPVKNSPAAQTVCPALSRNLHSVTVALHGKSQAKPNLKTRQGRQTAL